MLKGQMGQLMQQAQRMQEELQKNMEKAQRELAEAIVVGQAGGNLVGIKMNGGHEVLGVTIDPQLIGDDKELLEDLIAAAINDAINKVAELRQERMKGVTGGMNLPPGLNLPF